jgi:hypothetical protein
LHVCSLSVCASTDKTNNGHISSDEEYKNGDQDLFKQKNAPKGKQNTTNVTTVNEKTNTRESRTNTGTSVASTSSSNSSNNLNTSVSNGAEVVIKSPSKYVNSYYNSNHQLINSNSSSSSRARFAQENLERLEREKDDLFEL